MVTTNDDQLAARVRLFRAHGMTSLTWDREKGHSSGYDVLALGYNYRIDELRAAIGLVQLRKLEDNNRRRATIAETYREAFREVAGFRVPFSHAKGIAAHHIFPILLEMASARAGFIQFMREKGIQTSIHYRPVHTFSNYLSNQAASLPITDDVAGRLVTLPLYGGMTSEQVGDVIDAVRLWANLVALRA